MTAASDAMLARVRDALSAQYDVECEIGRGAAAVVYRAVDRRQKTTVAIKVLREEYGAAVSATRFSFEIEIGHDFDHPNVLRVLDHGQAGGLWYYVMPYVAGPTLRARLAGETHLTIPDALAIASDIAAALDFAHARRVIHRDVKPANVLLSGDRALVADFGIARAMTVAAGEELTDSGLALGTPEYMSPEQGGGERNLDGRTDIYALGCVLYEMLAGEPPFTGPTSQAIIARHCSEAPRSIRVIRPSVPFGVERAIERALAKVPADRFSTAGEFIAAATAGLSEARRKRRTRLQRALHVLGANPAARALILVGVAAGIVWLVRDSVDSGGATEGRSARPAPDTTRYAVLDTDTIGGAADGSELSEPVRDALRRWNGLTVVDGFQTQEALRRERGVNPARAHFAVAADALGAGRFIRLGASRVRDSLRVDAALVDTRADTALATATVRIAADLTRPDTALARLVDDLLLRERAVDTRVAARAGTASLPARQEFGRGHRALMNWDLTRADSAFHSATEHDPEYTQAYQWLALVRAWRGNAVAQWQYAADRAVAGSARLTSRDSIVALALAELARGQRETACGRWARLTTLDASDFSAWYGLAHCLRTDSAVVRDSHGARAWQYRSSYERALRAYETAFQLLPSIHLAFGERAFGDVLSWFMTNANLIRPGRAMGPDTATFAAYPVWQGDTIAFIPMPIAAFRSARTQTRSAASNEALVQQRRRFHRVASMWRATAPRSAVALEAVAVSLDLLGDPSAIDSMTRARTLSDDADARLRMASFEVWTRLKGALPGDLAAVRRARALADSALASAGNATGDAARVLSGFAALTGRAARAATFARSARVDVSRDTPPGLAQHGPALLTFSALGGPLDSIRALRAVTDRIIASTLPDAEQHRARITWIVRSTFLAALRPVADTLDAAITANERTTRLARALRTGDLAAAQAVASDMRAERRAHATRISDFTLDVLYPTAAILAALGDADAALAELTASLDSVSMAATASLSHPLRAAALVRGMALRAELAAELGRRAEAVLWARIVEELWRDADAFLRPRVRTMEQLSRR